MTDGTVFIQAQALGLEPAWRRLPEDCRAVDGAALLAAEAETADTGVRTLAWSTVGLEPGVDLLLFRIAPSMEALEAAGVRLLGAGLGTWLTVRHSLLGRVTPSQYVRKPTDQERSLLEGEQKSYLIVYPFTKTTEWYLLGRDTRQGIMNEHMRVGHAYPAVRQLLAYSFGLDDQDFVVAYDTDDLDAFGELVRELRATESRRTTANDHPILLGVRRTLPQLVAALGGTQG
jgi:chlorite dismutase